jgi:hypothetical protein
MSRKALEPTLYRAISNILYHPVLKAHNIRLFLANFGPIQYGDDGHPIDMVIDPNMPEYRSGILSSHTHYVHHPMSVEDMWVVLDEGNCLRCPDWARELFRNPMAIGRPARLLVPSEDGQRIVAIGSVQEPADDEDEDEDESFVAEFGQMVGDAF